MIIVKLTYKIKNILHCKKHIYNINFGYTQVLFMGSVPRINYLIVNVTYIVKY